MSIHTCTFKITINVSLQDDFGLAEVAKGEVTTLDRERFTDQRATAKQRGVPFYLTFEEWLGWWKSTGKYEDYGHYVMARKGDQGGYELDNIDCVARWQNSREATLRGTVNAWTPDEDLVVLEIEDDEEVSHRTGRSLGAVKSRRRRLTSQDRWPLRMSSADRQALCRGHEVEPEDDFEDEDEDDWGQIQSYWRDAYEDGAVALTEDECEALFGASYA